MESKFSTNEKDVRKSKANFRLSSSDLVSEGETISSKQIIYKK